MFLDLLYLHTQSLQASQGWYMLLITFFTIIPDEYINTNLLLTTFDVILIQRSLLDG